MAEEDSLGWTSPIHEAVWKNDVERVQQLIEENADLEAVVEECTPLYLACLKGHKDVAEVLIKGGAKVDGDSPPLFAAAGKGNLELVELLYKSGADPAAFSTQHAGCCALHIAAEKNYVDVVTALLSYGVSVNIRSGKQKLTPLISAACCGSLEAVEVLVKENADINAQSSTGNTALMLAIDRGKIDVALYLIKAGADLEVRGQKGWTALHNAASGGEKGYKEVAKALLEAGASVDALSETMLTPLHEAAGKSLVDLVALLVEWGADVNARDKFNNTALRMCASNAQSFATIDSFKQTVKILLDAGADINAGTTINTTSLHSVVKWGNIEAVKFMLENRANPNIETKKKELPIDFAKDTEMIHLLDGVTKPREKPSPAADTSKPSESTAEGGSKTAEELRATYSYDNWMPDSKAKDCIECGKSFSVINRKHHCRNCGLIFCDKCSSNRVKIPSKGFNSAVRVCPPCKRELGH
jgi:ankyrin repeat protein